MHRRRKLISPGHMKNLALLIKHILHEAGKLSSAQAAKEDGLRRSLRRTNVPVVSLGAVPTGRDTMFTLTLTCHFLFTLEISLGFKAFRTHQNMHLVTTTTAGHRRALWVMYIAVSLQESFSLGFEVWKL